MKGHQLDLFAPSPMEERRLSIDDFRSQVEDFDEFGTPTTVHDFPDKRFDIPVFVNEFWTAKQPEPCVRRLSFEFGPGNLEYPTNDPIPE